MSIREVARRAGVSPGTVSNVLNRPERVAPGTRERVHAAIRDLGFVRNGSAATLRAGQSRTIGLSVLDVANPFFTEIARGVEDAVSERGYAVILCNSSSSPDKEERNLRVLAEQRVRGVLITPAEEDPARLDALRARGIAVVMLDHPRHRADQCSVAVDDVVGGGLAVAHLLDRGAERVAFVNGPPSIRQCMDRRKGARQAIRAAGRRIGETLREVDMPEMTARAGEEAGRRLLEARPGPRSGTRSGIRPGGWPDAIFCANDLLALGVLRALLRAGVRVPDDIALIGYDDIDFTAAGAVPLSSIRQPTYQLGKIATELLLDECDNPAEHAHQQVMFQPELVVRASSGLTSG